MTSDKTTGSEINGIIYMGELAANVYEGIQIRGQLDYLKPNNDTEAGQKTRITVGVPLYFATGFELEPMIQIQTDKIVDPLNISAFKDQSYNSYLLMTHFYF